jgi:hypothetical protein
MHGPLNVEFVLSNDRPHSLLSSEGLTKKDKDNGKVQASAMIFLKCVHYAPD